jgi:hypothetical protein
MWHAEGSVKIDNRRSMAGREHINMRKNTRPIVSRIVPDTLDALKMSYPKTTSKRRQELLSMRKKLERYDIIRDLATTP